MTTATSLSENKAQQLPQHQALPLFILGCGSSKRAQLMQAARASLGLAPAQVIEWRDWLNAPACLDDLFQGLNQSTHTLKIEPPGDDAEVQRKLINAGCALLDRAPVAAVAFGELIATDAWFAGFSDTMHKLEQVLLRHTNVQAVNAPAEILLMTDKLACQQHLAREDIAVPALFGAVTGYEHLRALMAQHDIKRVFLKSRYGSSASGVLAYRLTDSGREQAITTAHMERGSDGVRIFNVKNVRQYDKHEEIVELIDLLAGHQAYAEHWLPKPRNGGGHYDVRLVTLAGKPAHRVARIGRRAMTNLHLDNQRGDLTAMLEQQDMHKLEHLAERAAGAFPASKVIGFDLVPGRNTAHVLEVNAFGDLLPGLLWRGRDSYAAQLEAFSS